MAEGAELDAVIGTFTDTTTAAGDTFTASIDWGDGTITDNATVEHLGDGRYQVRARHTYPDPGEYQLTAVVTGESGESTVVTGGVHVIRAALTPVPVSRALFDVGVSGNHRLLRRRRRHQCGQRLHRVRGLGRRNSHAGERARGPPGGPYLVRGTHTYTRPITFETTINVVDRGGGGGRRLLGTAVVDPAPLQVTRVVSAEALTGDTFSGELATFADPNSLFRDFFTATIDWGDGTQTPGTITGPAGGPYTVSGTHTYTSPQSR